MSTLAVDTTTIHNKVYRTFRPGTGAKVMCETCNAESKLVGKDTTSSQRHIEPLGIDVFHWPEFQALGKRLGIDLAAPIREITIQVPCDGLVDVVVTTIGLDTAKE